MGHVAGNFDRDEVINGLPGRVACGHVRYSTTGETALRNVQPRHVVNAELAWTPQGALEGTDVSVAVRRASASFDDRANRVRLAGYWLVALPDPWESEERRVGNACVSKCK